jgi:hypothetical protein
MAYLKIKRSAMSRFTKGMIEGFTFKVEVLEADGLPVEIFVFLKVPQPSDPDESDDVFQNVASPTDLQEYPALMPVSGANRPFFRLSEVTLRFRSESLAEDTWRCMQSDFDSLITAIGEAADLVVVEVMEYGTAPSSSSSPSSSQSSA